jgi:hypothetical protein
MTVYTEKVYKETAISTVVCKCCSEFFVFSCLICYYMSEYVTAMTVR